MGSVSKGKIRIGEGPHGRGVFAAKAIAEGEVIEVCPTLEVDAADASGRLGDYVFDSNSEAETVVLPLGYGMLYNHSDAANADYEEDGPDRIAYVATRPIRAGEEVTIDYGREWWDTRGLEPG